MTKSLMASMLSNQFVDLRSAEFVEVKITSDRRVYVSTEEGTLFRAYNVGRVILEDERHDHDQVGGDAA